MVSEVGNDSFVVVSEMENVSFVVVSEVENASFRKWKRRSGLGLG